jgi:2-amino-4-hydroxy-6-hydroxymethyldihydropteridine diphosphokinase
MLRLKLRVVKMIYKYYLCLGSNIEPRLNYLKLAEEELGKFGKIHKKSSVYESQAWGHEDQSNFLNAVIEFHCRFMPQELLVRIKSLEEVIGRSKTYRWGPREIDIDIILCKQLCVNETHLQIPHPYFHKRRFVLEPFAELDENYIVSGTKKTLAELLIHCDDTTKVSKAYISW